MRRGISKISSGAEGQSERVAVWAAKGMEARAVSHLGLKRSTYGSPPCIRPIREGKNSLACRPRISPL
jgi:hypothetical protein